MQAKNAFWVETAEKKLYIYVGIQRITKEGHFSDDFKWRRPNWEKWCTHTLVNFWECSGEEKKKEIFPSPRSAGGIVHDEEWTWFEHIFIV
jgi:hypothetical protein